MATSNYKTSHYVGYHVSSAADTQPSSDVFARANAVYPWADSFEGRILA